MPSHGTDSPSSSREGGPDTAGGNGSGLPPFESSPFTDWREQLRERVKEIRARKLADRREAEERPATGSHEQAEGLERQADAARDEKLQVARARAAEARQAPAAEADRAAASDAPQAAAPDDEQPVAGATTEASDPAAEEATEETTDEQIARAAHEALERIRAEAHTRAAAHAAAGEPAVSDSVHSFRDEVPLFQDDESETPGGDSISIPDGLHDTAVGEPSTSGAAMSDDETRAAGVPMGTDAVPEDAAVFLDDDLEDPVGDATLTPDEIPWRTDWDSSGEDSGDVEARAKDDDMVWEDDPPRPTAPDASPEADRQRPQEATDEEPALAPAGALRQLDNIPAWARPRVGDLGAAESGDGVPPPDLDLDAIPAELKDVAIPSWAIPRRGQRATSPRSGGGAGASIPPSAEVEEIEVHVATEIADETDDEIAAETAAEIEPAAIDTPDDLPARRSADGRGRITDLLPWEEEPTDASATGTGTQSGAESEEDDRGDDGDEPPTSSPPWSRGSGERRDDVYLVGEFTGRQDAGEQPPAAAWRERGDDSDPLESLRFERASGQRPDRPIPKLFEDGDEDDEIEVAPPPPFRELFDGSDAATADDDGSRNGRAHREVEIDVDGMADDGMTADAGTILEDDRRSGKLDPSAPMSDRVFSTLADALVVVVMGLALGLAGASAAGTGMLSFVQAAPIPFAGTWLIFAFVYSVFFVGTCGQTLGKMAMRVRVIGADRFQVGYVKATRRALLYTLTALPAGVGLLPALNDPEHRAMHDRLSGTRVVKA